MRSASPVRKDLCESSEEPGRRAGVLTERTRKEAFVMPGFSRLFLKASQGPLHRCTRRRSRQSAPDYFSS